MSLREELVKEKLREIASIKENSDSAEEENLTEKEILDKIEKIADLTEKMVNKIYFDVFLHPFIKELRRIGTKKLTRIVSESGVLIEDDIENSRYKLDCIRNISNLTDIEKEDKLSPLFIIQAALMNGDFVLHKEYPNFEAFPLWDRLVLAIDLDSNDSKLVINKEEVKSKVIDNIKIAINNSLTNTIIELFKNLAAKRKNKKLFIEDSNGRRIPAPEIEKKLDPSKKYDIATFMSSEFYYPKDILSLIDEGKIKAFIVQTIKIKKQEQNEEVTNDKGQNGLEQNKQGLNDEEQNGKELNGRSNDEEQNEQELNEEEWEEMEETEIEEMLEEKLETENEKIEIEEEEIDIETFKKMLKEKFSKKRVGIKRKGRSKTETITTQSSLRSLKSELKNLINNLENFPILLDGNKGSKGKSLALELNEIYDGHFKSTFSFMIFKLLHDAVEVIMEKKSMSDKMPKELIKMIESKFPQELQKEYCKSGQDFSILEKVLKEHINDIADKAKKLNYEFQSLTELEYRIVDYLDEKCEPNKLRQLKEIAEEVNRALKKAGGRLKRDLDDIKQEQAEIEKRNLELENKKVEELDETDLNKMIKDKFENGKSSVMVTLTFMSSEDEYPRPEKFTITVMNNPKEQKPWKIFIYTKDSTVETVKTEKSGIKLDDLKKILKLSDEYKLTDVTVL